MARNLNFQAPPQLDIAEGDTHPNPGWPGAMAWSTTLGMPVIWAGSTWRAFPLDVQNQIPNPGLDIDLLSASIPTDITFSRGTNKSFFGMSGVLLTSGVDECPLEYDQMTLQAIGRSFWEQRTNLLLHSVNLSTGWAKGSSATWIPNQSAPDGSMTAIGVTGLSGTSIISSASSIYRANNVVSPNTVYTASIYARARDSASSPILLRLSETGGNNSIGPETQLNTEKWTRLALTITTGLAASAVTFVVGTKGPMDLGRCDFWGAQLEEGAGASNYIFTTNAQTTRSADLAQVDLPEPMDILIQDRFGAQWINGVSAGVQTLAPRPGQRHIARWRAWSAGRLNAAQKSRLAVPA